MSDLDKIIFGKKKFSDLLQEIYTNQKKKEKQISTLIQELNDGKIDTQYPINWGDYQNSILLVNDGVLKKMSTKIYKIISL